MSSSKLMKNVSLCTVHSIKVLSFELLKAKQVVNCMRRQKQKTLFTRETNQMRWVVVFDDDKRDKRRKKKKIHEQTQKTWVSESECECECRRCKYTLCCYNIRCVCGVRIIEQLYSSLQAFQFMYSFAQS